MDHPRQTSAIDGLERLWTPHRMQYIVGDRRVDQDQPSGCPFCAMREPHEDDLVVRRGEHAFAVLNLHPYNPGHLMVLPWRHVPDLEDLTAEESAELMSLTAQAIATIKRISSPHAFNVGLNLGAAAGGSLAAHLHQHVVPRWNGDANFITVVGGGKVLPQLLAETRDLIVQEWQ